MRFHRTLRSLAPALAGTLAGALLFAAAPGFAATVSYTGSASGAALIYDPATDYSPSTGYSPPGSLGGYDGLIALSGFNTALGTLNSVTLTTAASGTLEFKDAYSFGYPTDIINATLYITGQTPYGGSGVGLPFTFSSPGHGSGAIFDTGSQSGSDGGSYTNSLSGTFSPFYVSTFYVPVLAYAYTTIGTNTSYLTNVTSTFTYQETVTYDYTPSVVPVPEPSTWALTIGGIGLAGAALRRRRGALLA